MIALTSTDASADEPVCVKIHFVYSPGTPTQGRIWRHIAAYARQEANPLRWSEAI